MRRALVYSTAVLALGLVALVCCLVTFVLIAGVPYHDGLYAGHVHGPGIERWLEEVAFVPILLVSVSCTLAGLLGVLGCGAVHLARGRGSGAEAR